MFESYFESDKDAGREYARCRSLIDSMATDVASRSPQPQASSMVDDLDRYFTDAPIPPSTLLRSSLDHSLLNLQHVVTAIRAGGVTSIPVLMSAMRISLLASSHLCYVSTAATVEDSRSRMATLYRLEARSAKKYVDLFPDKVSDLPGLHPAKRSTVRTLASFNPPAQSITETGLLSSLKDETLTELAAAVHESATTTSMLTDHLFNTTSGAAHGYAWIDAPGVIAHFASQFSWTTALSNIVFNKYLVALTDERRA